MAVRKQRATTSKAYAMDQDYNKTLDEAKKIHRIDNEFYIYSNGKIYSSVNIREVEIYNYNKEELEHWMFYDRGWHRVTK